MERLEFSRAYIFLATAASFCMMAYSDLDISVYKLPSPGLPVIDDRFAFDSILVRSMNFGGILLFFYY